MSAILRMFGLESTAATKATHDESRDAFDAQISETSVTRASRYNTAMSDRLGRTLSKSLSVAIERDLSGRDRAGHAD